MKYIKIILTLFDILKMYRMCDLLFLFEIIKFCTKNFHTNTFIFYYGFSENNMAYITLSFLIFLKAIESADQN